MPVFTARVREYLVATAHGSETSMTAAQWELCATAWAHYCTGWGSPQQRAAIERTIAELEMPVQHSAVDRTYEESWPADAW